MMVDLKDLAPVELEIMDVLWRKGEASARDVQEALRKGRKPAYTTVATMLMRLKDKGYVEAEERNFRFIFRPLVQRESVIRRKLDDLVERVFGGSLEPLATYITEQRDLTPEQLAALEEILRAKKKEGK